MYSRILRPVIVPATASFACCAAARADEAAAGPDLTKILPADTSKAYNLGPTGLPGWMHVERRRLVPGDIEPTPLTVNPRQFADAIVDLIRNQDSHYTQCADANPSPPGSLSLPVSRR